MNKDEVICTCGTGWEAAAAFLVVIFLLGRKARLHEGGFIEWVGAGMPTSAAGAPSPY
jgi:3-mercaptopyruvate sulfurtransferase SseA